MKDKKPKVNILEPTDDDKIAKQIGAELIIPEYSHCANAVGAVVGKVVKSPLGTFEFIPPPTR